MQRVLQLLLSSISQRRRLEGNIKETVYRKVLGIKVASWLAVEDKTITNNRKQINSWF